MSIERAWNYWGTRIHYSDDLYPLPRQPGRSGTMICGRRGSDRLPARVYDENAYAGFHPQSYRNINGAPICKLCLKEHTRRLQLQRERQRGQRERLHARW